MVFAWGINIVNLLRQQSASDYKATWLKPEAEVRHAGFGKHLPDPPGQLVVTWFKYLYIYEFMYTLSQISNKFSM